MSSWVAEEEPILHKKWSFPLSISSVNVTKFAVFCGAKNSFGILIMVYDRVGNGDKFSDEFFVLEGLAFMLQSPKTCILEKLKKKFLVNVNATM